MGIGFLGSCDVGVQCGPPEISDEPPKGGLIRRSRGVSFPDPHLGPSCAQDGLYGPGLFGRPQAGRGEPFVHMRGSFRLPGEPDQSITGNAWRGSPRFLSKALRLLRHTLIELGRLFEMGSFHGAAPFRRRKAGAQLSVLSSPPKATGQAATSKANAGWRCLSMHFWAAGPSNLMDAGGRDRFDQDQSCIPHGDAASGLQSEFLRYLYRFIVIRQFEQDDAPLLRDIGARYVDNVRKRFHCGARGPGHPSHSLMCAAVSLC